MNKPQIEKFTIKTIADAVSRQDVSEARVALSEMIGAVIEVSGRIEKIVKRAGQEKLVIETSNLPGFIVFAVFPDGLENLRKLKLLKLEILKNKSSSSETIRKGSAVSFRGRLTSFGSSAVSLNECRIGRIGRFKKGRVVPNGELSKN